MHKMRRKQKAPKTRNDGTLTEAEFFQQIRHGLRKQFRWWKPMLNALNKARRNSQNKKNPRLKYEYQCAICKKWFPRTGVQIDHKIPCGELRSYDDIVPFIKNLTREGTNSYQVLCKKDHLVKTKEEKKARNESKIKKHHPKRRSKHSGNSKGEFKKRGQARKTRGPNQLPDKEQPLESL